ncbi:MAG: hypothetical protein R3D55_16480 [Chloroflexota bacterium]
MFRIIDFGCFGVGWVCIGENYEPFEQIVFLFHAKALRGNICNYTTCLAVSGVSPCHLGSVSRQVAKGQTFISLRLCVRTSCFWITFRIFSRRAIWECFTPSRKGQTLFHLAALRENLLLLDNLSDFLAPCHLGSVSRQVAKGQTLFHLAALRENLLLLDNLSDFLAPCHLGSVSRQVAKGQTLFHLAALRENLLLLDNLSDFLAPCHLGNVSRQVAKGQTLFHLAALRENLLLMNLLSDFRC